MKFIEENLTPELKEEILEGDFEFYPEQGSRSLLYHSENVLLKQLNSRYVDEMQNEIDATIDLQGIPSVPKLYAYDMAEKSMYMEKIEGQDLFEYCRSNEVPIEDFRTKLKVQMYLMLECGWIYGDVKIEHIIVIDPFSFKIVDFGMSDKVRNYSGAKEMPVSMIDSSVDHLIEMYKNILK